MDLRTVDQEMLPLLVLMNKLTMEARGISAELADQDDRKKRAILDIMMNETLDRMGALVSSSSAEGLVISSISFNRATSCSFNLCFHPSNSSSAHPRCAALYCSSMSPPLRR